MNPDPFFGRYMEAAELRGLLEETRPNTGYVQALTTPVQEDEWAASHLLTALLAAATRKFPPLNRREAQRIIEESGSQEAIEELERRACVRFVLGWLEVPFPARQAARAPNAEEQLGVLANPLRRLIDARARKNPFWLSEQEARELRERHAGSHQNTPDLDGLIELGVIVATIHDECSGFTLSFETEDRPCLWSALGKLVARRLWAHASNRDQPDDAARLEWWLERVVELEDWSESPDEMNPDLRDRLTAAARERAMHESDIVGRNLEPLRVEMETDLAFPPAGRIGPMPSAEAGLLEAWKWWREIERIPYRPWCRRRLDGLLRLASWSARADWRSPLVVGWLMDSHERPYLMHFLLQYAGYSMRSNLVTLLNTPETTSLGLSLIAELEIGQAPYDFRLDQEARSARYREQKARLWNGAVELLATWLTRTAEGHVERTVRAMGEALLIASRAVEAARRDDGERDAAQQRLGALVDALEATGLLTDHVAPLRAWLTEDSAIEEERSDTSESLPTARLRVLFSALNVALSPYETEETARAIAALYVAELQRWTSAAGGSIVNWYRSGERTARLPWGDVARVLSGVNEADRVIVPDGLDLEAALGSVEQVLEAFPADKRPSLRHDLHRTWLQKARCHLSVLFRVHNALADQEHEAIRRFVEARVSNLIAASARADRAADLPGLFDPELDPSFEYEEPAEPFALLAIKAINRFSPVECTRAFTTWSAQESHPVTLLRVSAMAVPELARQAAVERLEALDLDAFLDEQVWLPTFERLAEAAALAARPDLARRVLEHVDKLDLKDEQRTRWNSLAYRIRLMIAYQEGDVEALARLDVPGAPRGPYDRTQQGSRSSQENAKRFYEGLLYLEKRPEAALETFEALLRENPRSAANAVNRFAAELRVADDVKDQDNRRAAFTKALIRWEDAATRIPQADLQEVSRFSHYSRLVALDGAHRDGEFDDAWDALPSDLKADLSFVSIAVNNRSRRGQVERAQAILDNSKPYHLDANGQESNAFLEIQEVVRTGKQVELGDAVIETPDPDFKRLRELWRVLMEVDLETFVRVVGQHDATPNDYIADALLEVAREFLNRAHLFQGFDEDSLSDVLWSLLRSRLTGQWEIHDQPRGGRSQTGDRVGERDGVIKFRKADVAILEAIRLTYKDETTIPIHVQKASINYNPTGVNYIYIVVYYQGKQWEKFWENYYRYVRNIPLDGFEVDLTTCIDFPMKRIVSTNLRLACVSYRRDGMIEPRTVYHLALNVPETTKLTLSP